MVQLDHGEKKEAGFQTSTRLGKEKTRIRNTTVIARSTMQPCPPARSSLQIGCSQKGRLWCVYKRVSTATRRRVGAVIGEASHLRTCRPPNPSVVINIGNLAGDLLVEHHFSVWEPLPLLKIRWPGRHHLGGWSGRCLEQAPLRPVCSLSRPGHFVSTTSTHDDISKTDIQRRFLARSSFQP